MKHWLNVALILCLALTVFSAGLTLGRLGWSPQVALADSTNNASSGGDGGFLSWEQEGDQLKITVGGPEATYVGIATLSQEDAWADLGDGEALMTGEEVVFDLSAVEDMTFYRMEAVAQMKEGILMPCAQLPYGCFPVRPPIPQPRGVVFPGMGQ